MIVVVASRHDAAAREIVAKWSADNAALLTCEDLSTVGWRHHLFHTGPSTAVVSGKIVGESEIRGVLVRRPWLFEQELTHIAREDREYVTAEMNSFLISWLSHLSCPVLNRPAGTCLCGPAWRPQQWAQAAASVGMKIEPSLFSTPSRNGHNKAHAAPSCHEVTIVGDRCFGARDECTAAYSRKLAQLANTPLLTVRIADKNGCPHFFSARTIPQLIDAEVLQAVRQYLCSE